MIVMHGSGGTGADARAGFGWDAVADREGFVVAGPDGLDRSWNGGSCCRPSSARGVDDVGYLRELVTRLAAEDGIDPRRVVATSFSNVPRGLRHATGRGARVARHDHDVVLPRRADGDPRSRR